MTKEGISKILESYFGYPAMVYTYELNRVKEGFQLGTITIDDFTEWDKYDIDSLADYIITMTQTPRVLELDEIVPGMVVYYEDRYYDDRKWICEVEENKHKRFSNSIILFGCGNVTERDKSSYGETWRLWTDKPDEEMMKREKWNEC